MDVEKKVEEKKLSSILNSIQIALDGYDDIFSDFDPSPYNHRLLSDDFIKEIQKRYIETRKGDFEVRFSLPQIARDPKIEALIKKRFKEYFFSQIKEINSQIESKQRMGIVRVAMGFLLLSIELVGRLYGMGPNFIFDLLTVIIVPAGWYSMYSGLEFIFDHPQKMVEQRKFLKKFHDAIYLFVSEEDLVSSIETTSDQRPLEIFLTEKGEKAQTSEVKKETEKK
ncbi:MAG: hypothetical protein WCT31_02840 [Candidatus Micrarchaeia archaeon]|jgi:hypothetical protein